MEEMIRNVFKQALDVDLPNPFPRMSYAEAMRRYGSDKPDLRVTLELTEVTDAVADVAFKVFSGPATSGGRVAAMRMPGGASTDPRRDRRLHRVRQDLRRPRAGLHQGQRRHAS